jgi:hypothetical protein
MKTLKLFIIFLLFTSFSIFSQNNYGGRNSGVNRDIGRSYSGPSKPSAEEIEKVRAERIEKYVMKLKSDLTLDELQVIAIRNEITSNSKNIDIVLKKENSEEEKSNEVKAMMEKSDATINSYLNKDQKEKYLLLKNAMKDKKKGKKSKKEKNTEPTIEE